MSRVLITGFSGFVATHFVEHLASTGLHHDVFRISRKLPSFDFARLSKAVNVTSINADLMDAEKLRRIVRDIQPNHVLHLAASSSVAYSWKHPAESLATTAISF